MPRARRVSVDLNEKAAAEIDRLKDITSLSTADLFRHSVTLLRVYVNARAEGREFRITNPKDPSDQVRLELPISLGAPTEEQTSVGG